MSTKTLHFDRREFIAVAAGAALVASLPFGSLATPALGAPERRERLADWSIDDQWGVVPRWDAVPCAPQHAEDPRLAVADPVDHGFVT